MQEPPVTPDTSAKAHWRANLRLTGLLLAIWAFVSFGCGIFFRRWLDQWHLPGTGFPLGFWFAQQGSILIFILLIFIYAWRMNRIDKAHGVQED